MLAEQDGLADIDDDDGGGYEYLCWSYSYDIISTLSYIFFIYRHNPL